MSFERLKSMVVVVALVVGAFVPACCCWTRGMAIWGVGSAGDGLRADEQVGVDGCCADGACCEHEYGGQGTGGPGTPRGPGHEQACGCGVEYRALTVAPASPLDFEPAMVGWMELGAPMGGELAGTPRGAGGRWAWGDGRLRRPSATLLRLHCALVV